jgi:hypothetical protein
VGTGVAIARIETATSALRAFSSTSATLPPMPQ